jgi:hypothetical protein
MEKRQVAILVFVLFLIFLFLLIYYWQPYHQKLFTEPTHLEEYLENIPLKNGDLAMFRANNASIERHYITGSYFTHVGIIWYDPRRNEYVIIERMDLNEKLERCVDASPIIPRATEYQGWLYILPLKQPLTETQNQKLNDTIFSFLRINPQSIKYPFGPRDEQLMKNPRRERISAMSIAKHSLLACTLPEGISKGMYEEGSLLCTDFVMYVLQQSDLIPKDICHTCIQSSYFLDQPVFQQMYDMKNITKILINKGEFIPLKPPFGIGNSGEIEKEKGKGSKGRR